MLPPTPAGPPLLQIQHRRATITLNRPAHHNRLHAQDLLVLQQHFQALAADPTLRLLVLTGSGATFCSGFHIAELGDSATSAHAGPQLFAQTVDALEALPLPTICRLNGSAYGGATDMALACDFRIGVVGGDLFMPAARLGLHYYRSGLERFVARLGLNAAMRLFLTAERLDSAEMQAIGYLTEVVEAETLAARVDALTATLAGMAPLALLGMKKNLQRIARGTLDAAELQADITATVQSADLQEGRAAWAEKRAPKFTGR